MASLAADRNTSLPELLAEAARGCRRTSLRCWWGRRSTGWIPWLSRLWRRLAVYGWPVPPVAVDYLLQPYLVAIDSAPVLGRLVNMQFVRRDAGRYYLHRSDRRLPPSAAIPQGSRHGMPGAHSLGMRYLPAAPNSSRNPHAAGVLRSLTTFSRSFAEFNLRCAAGDYDTAATVLAETIELRLHAEVGALPTLVIDLHQGLQEHLRKYPGESAPARPDSGSTRRWARRGGRSIYEQARLPSTAS